MLQVSPGSKYLPDFPRWLDAALKVHEEDRVHGEYRCDDLQPYALPAVSARYPSVPQGPFLQVSLNLNQTQSHLQRVLQHEENL